MGDEKKRRPPPAKPPAPQPEARAVPDMPAPLLGNMAMQHQGDFDFATLPDIQWPGRPAPSTKSGELEFTLGFGPSLRKKSPCGTGCHAPNMPREEDPGDPRVTTESLKKWAIDNGWYWIKRPEMQPETLVLLTAASDGLDYLINDIREDLFDRVATSGEFAGTASQRDDAGEALAFSWREVETELRRRTEEWYLGLLSEALARTPQGGELETRSGAILQILSAPLQGTANMGRWDATAKVGDSFGPWRIVQIQGEGNAVVWIEHTTHRGFYYVLGPQAFTGMDPLIAMVFGTVAKNAAFAAMILPLLIKGAGLALGVSTSLSFVVAGILLEELGEEGMRSAMGKPGRSLGEIAQSAAGALFVDRFFWAIGRVLPTPTPKVAKAPMDPAALKKAEAILRQDALFAKAELMTTRKGVKVPGMPHHVKVTPSGYLAHCTQCALLRTRYADELAQPTEKAQKLKSELDELQLASHQATQARNASEIARIEGLAADLARRLQDFRVERRLAEGKPLPLDEFDFGPVSAMEVIGIATGRQRMPSRVRQFGDPSGDLTGTFMRQGAHAGELTAAEVAIGVRQAVDKQSGQIVEVSYRVDKGASAHAAQTSRSFTVDPALGRVQSSARGYRSSGYEKGHLVQREAAKGDQLVERSVDSYGLVVPMSQALNRGQGSSWRASEALTMRWADQYGHVHVQVVPHYGANPMRLPDGTPIPIAIRRKVTAPDGTVLQDSSHLNR